MRAAAIFLGALAALAVAAPLRAAESNDIKTKLETCFACHGTGGVSQIENVPSIAAQPNYFTQWQLVFFRAGSRKSEIMGPIAAELSNEDLKAIGPLVQALPAPPPSQTPDDAPELTKAGATLAVDRHCNSCHTANFAGKEAAARLAGQREEILLKALQDYKSGVRTGTGVAAMPEVAFSLSEEQMKVLAHYLSRLP
jgi:cytochrome c553